MTGRDRSSAPAGARCFPRARIFACLAIMSCVAATDCGPELTDPADTDVSGAWFAAGPAAGMTDINVQLTQSPDGSISGTYTAVGTPGLQFCPATGVCSISSTVSGSNSVLQVFFELKDAGQFSGQLISATELKGAMSRISSTQPIQFTRP